MTETEKEPTPAAYDSAELRQRALRGFLVIGAFILFGMIQVPGIFNGGFRWDESLSEYIPWRIEVGRQLAEGHFPFFTDRVFGGMPLFPTSYSGVLYPANWLYAAFPPWISAWIAFGHTVLGGCGMYLYLRSRRLSVFPAFAGAMLFLSCTFMLSHYPHVSMREAALMAPWVVWLARRLLRNPGPGRALLLAAAIALHISIGYQQLYLFAVLWIGAEWLESLHLRRQTLAATLWLAFAGILGTALMGIQIFPALEHVGLTPRATMTLEEWTDASFNPSHAPLFFSPRIFSYAFSNWIGDSYSTELHATIPAFGWALALAAPFLYFASRRGRRNPRLRGVAIYTVLTIVSLALATGTYLPGYDTLFNVPPFNLFRVPARYLYLANTFAVILAATAIQALLWQPWWKRLTIFLMAFAALAGICFGAYFLFLNLNPDSRINSLDIWEYGFVGSKVALGHIDNMLDKWRLPKADGFFDMTGIHVIFSVALALSLLFMRKTAAVPAVLVFVILCADSKIMNKYALFDFGRPPEIVEEGGNPLLTPETREDIVRLYSLSPNGSGPGYLGLPGNTFLFHDLRALNGYCPLLSSRVWDILRIGQTGVGYRDADFLRNPAPLRHLAVSHMILDRRLLDNNLSNVYTENLGFEYGVSAWKDNSMLLEVFDTRPRFDLAQRWRPADPGELDSFVFVHDPAHPSPQAVLEDVDWDRLPQVDTPIPAGTVSVLADDSSFQSVQVDSPQGAVLLIRDVHWPGWRYRIVEQDPNDYEDVSRANGLVRYIPVPPGKFTVEMYYRPPGWKRGVAVSLGALAVYLAIFIGLLIWRVRVGRAMHRS